jgi:hypothetical protein
LEPGLSNDSLPEQGFSTSASRRILPKLYHTAHLTTVPVYETESYTRNLSLKKLARFGYLEDQRSDTICSHLTNRTTTITIVVAFSTFHTIVHLKMNSPSLTTLMLALLAAFFLLLRSTAAQEPVCDLLNETCDYPLDLECDAGTFCPANSDCFDCDPFQRFRDMGCNECVANGGVFCELSTGQNVCSSPEMAAIFPNACLGSGGTNYTSTCPELCNVLYDTCQSAGDLECDDETGTAKCPANSDCFDCDLLQKSRGLGCVGCVANGGMFCELANGTNVCSSPEIAAIGSGCLLGRWWLQLRCDLSVQLGQ